MREPFILMVISRLAISWVRGSSSATTGVFGSHFDTRWVQECPSISIDSECTTRVIEHAKCEYPHIGQLNYKLRKQLRNVTALDELSIP